LRIRKLALGFFREHRKFVAMKADADVIEIPTAVFDSVDTLDELEDWLMAKNPNVMRELRQARREDLAGKFIPWKLRHLSGNGKSR
jgi:hypothetical protein